MRACPVEKNSSYFPMKIKLIFIFSLAITLFWGMGFAEEDCSYYDGTAAHDDGLVAMPAGSFDQLYNQHLCEETNPINAEAIKYVQSIKKMEGKSIIEITQDIGKTFCYEGFPGCTKKSFYYRYIDACKIAHKKARDEVKVALWEDDKLLKDAELNCKKRAKIFVDDIYKKVAFLELSRYNEKLIEASNKKYIEKSHEYVNSLSNIMNTFLKKIGNISNQFEWYTRNVYNTWFTTGSSGH